MSEGTKPDPAAVPESLATAMLLAGTAGLLDAATYVLHGRVFATAMTGNTVLLGIAGASGDWFEVVRHAVPILAFLAVVAVSKAARISRGNRATTMGLLLEAAALGVAGWLPGRFPETLFTGGNLICVRGAGGGFAPCGPL